MNLKNVAKVFHLDGWVNVLTGLGQLNKDKRTGASIEYSPFQESDAASLYAGDDIAAKIVDLLPDEALREPFEVTGVEEAQAQAISKEFERLKAVQAMNKAWKWARLFGGSGIFMVTNDSRDLAEPMQPNAKLLSLVVMSRWELVADFESIETDIRKTNFGMPTLYNFYPRSASTDVATKIHASRIIRFDGVELPERERVQNQYWGDSILNRLYNAIRNYNSVHDSAASVMQDFRVAVFKIKNLADRIAGGDDQAVIKRLQLVDLSRSIARAVVIDADGEDFEYRSGTVSGMPELISKAENRLVAGTNIPHTVLLGESPSGSNATGNSTVLGWYDYIASQQSVYLKPKHQELILKVMASIGIQPPLGWDVSYAPLWQMDEKEISELRNKNMQTDVGYIDAGVLSQEEVRESRFGGKKYSSETSLQSTPNYKPLPAPVPAPKL